ncbi:tape measure protein [Acinetobacter ursingii]|uniref:Tape measure protein n=1 Tax=Acinetobacter ursingii TaxID=108980 RepID=A0AA46NQU7_9GAMM|nr:tape measure protein [Acinetobacter ursingii]UYF76652.1 tape measure protein [Acinetobacter ursingii]
MAEAKSSLLITISTEQAKKNSDELKKALNEVTLSGDKVSNSAEKVGKTSSKSAQEIAIMSRALLGLAAAGASVLLPLISIDKIISTQRTFDKLNAGLITATKSAENAKLAFSALQKFATETPYGLEQAVDGFTKLVNLGLTPSERAMKSYGNTASAMGKDLNQMIEAVADATTSEFERLKEFGIKAKQQGDKVTLTFQGMSKTIGNNAKEIEEYLIKLGENQFAGAMAERMNTLDGSIANLNDSWEALYLAISQAGVGELVRSGVDLASESVQGLTTIVSSGAIETALAGMANAFSIFGSSAQDDLNSLRGAFDFTGDFMVEKWRATINELNTIGNAWVTIQALTKKAGVSIAAGVDIVSDPFNKRTSNASKNEIYKQSMQGIDDWALSKWDSISKATNSAEKKLEAYKVKLNESSKSTKDVLEQFKVKGDGSKAPSSDSEKKKALAEARKHANELARIDEERFRIQYAYSSKSAQIDMDLQKEIARLQKYGMTQYIAEAQKRAEQTKSINEAQLAHDLYSFKMTEEEKLTAQTRINEKRILANKELTNEEKKSSIKALKERYDYEITQYRLAKEQRMLQSKEFFLSEMQLVQARYELEKKLLAQSKEDPSEKEFKLKMLELQNQMGMDKRLKDASMGWDSVQAQMNGSSGRYQVGQERFSRMSVSQNLFDTQLADVEMQEKEPGADLQKLAEVREQIWAAHNQRMIDIENQYQTDSLNLQLTQAQQLTGSFANMFKGILGESSGAYKTMFAMQQGFALTQAGMNLWSSVSDAYAKEPGTVWQKMAAGAKAALDQGTFLAMIQAITPQGFSTGGHVRGSGTETSDSIPAMLSDNEYVIKAKSVRSLGVDTLDYINRMGELPVKRASGGSVGDTSSYIVDRYKSATQPISDGGIQIAVSVNDSGVSTSGANTQDQKQLGQMIGNAVRAVIRQEQRQGGLLSK